MEVWQHHHQLKFLLNSGCQSQWIHFILFLSSWGLMSEAFDNIDHSLLETLILNLPSPSLATPFQFPLAGLYLMFKGLGTRVQMEAYIPYV